MATYPKAAFWRLPVLIFILLLFSFWACTAGNPDVAIEIATSGDAIEGTVGEENSSLSNNEAIPSVSEETVEVSSIGTVPAVQSGQTVQTEKEGIGNYTLVKGENYPICREFLENLNYFKGKGETPMACDMRIAPQFEKFRTLNWEEMPIDEEFLKNLVYDRWVNFADESEESLERRWKQFYSRYLGKYKYPDAELSISKAPVQIFRDGRKNYTLQQLHNKNWCANAGPAGGGIFILSGNMRIDRDSFPFSSSGESYGDLFYYDGKIRNFETSFSSSINPREPYPVRKIYPAVVRLYDIIEGTKSTLLRRQEICAYTYE